MTFTDTCLTGETLTQLTLVTTDFGRYDLVTCAPPFALAGGGNWRGMTPYTVSSKVLGPSIPGEAITNVRATVRNILIPIIIRGTTETLFDEALGSLESRLSAMTGPCELIYQRADGTRRAITVTYIGGADQLAVHDLSRERHVVANCLFRAHYPYWRAVTGAFGESTGNFLNAAGAGSNAVDLYNDGDVDSWPEILLSGPLENVEAANISTGQMWRMVEIIGPGQTVRIESDPRNRGIWLGNDWRPDVLDPAVAELWPLLPGLNRLVLRATSPGDAGTWRIRWPNLYGTC